MKLRDIYNEVVSMIAAGHPTQAVKDFLKSQGAEYVGSGCFSSCWAMEFEWGTVAIKFAFAGYPVNSLGAHEKREFPLLWRRYVKPLFSSEFVVIQPLVENQATTPNGARFRKAANILAKWLDRLYGCDMDCHMGNVGFYRGKMMIFDPLTQEMRDDASELLGGG